jgi:hypothetical protein
MTATAATRVPDARPRHDEGELEMQIVLGRDAFVQLERAWNDALARGPRDEPMLRHEWMRAYIENFAPGATLRTFVARAGREIHAAVPLIETRDRSTDTCHLPMTTWSLPVNDHSQRGGVLLGRRWKEGLEAIWRALRTLQQSHSWDRLRLRDLPEGAGEWELRALAERDRYPCGLWVSLRSPYLPLPELPAPGARPQGSGQNKVEKLPSAGGRFELVEAALDGKFRQNLRRRRRRLAEKGEVKYVLLDGKDAAALDEGLADFFTIEGSGWKGKGGTAIAQRPELVGFYTQIARDAAKRGALALGFLELSGQRIAAHLSMVHAGKHYLLKLGYDEALHEFSPGQQLTTDAIRDSCTRGLREFDFLGPCMEWKLDWESKLRQHTWLTIFRPTIRGRLVHEARYTLWPILRGLLHDEES